MSFLTPWNRRESTGALAPTRIRDEMDRAFGRFFHEPWSLLEPKMLRAEGWFPPVDVSETDQEVTIRAEAPGLAAKDLDISISGTTLTIAGHKEEQTEQKGENFHRCERCFGSFRRMIELPETVDAEKITAETDHGVVTIHVAKKPGVRTRKVEVKTQGRKTPVTT